MKTYRVEVTLNELEMIRLASYLAFGEDLHDHPSKDRDAFLYGAGEELADTSSYKVFSGRDAVRTIVEKLGAEIQEIQQV